MSKILTSLLVGTHFHPPAKTLLDHLPVGTPLRLAPEPDNPWDSDAITVWLVPSAIPASQHEALRERLPSSGFDLDELLASGEAVLLGHVAASGGKPLAKAKLMQEDLVGNLEMLPHVPAEASLAFGLDGSLQVKLALAAP